MALTLDFKNLKKQSSFSVDPSKLKLGKNELGQIRKEGSLVKKALKNNYALDTPFEVDLELA